MATEEGARGLPVYMIPDAELSRARYFLTGWTLARYASRFRADQEDGVDLPPAGAGAFGWTKTGPPGASPRRSRPRRPQGVLTIPSSATVGQVRASPAPVARVPLDPFDETLTPTPALLARGALRDLAAADVLAAPAVDAATGDYVGWITCGSLLRQILRALYPRMLAPELLAQDDLEAFLYRPENLANASPDARTVLAAMVSEAETQYTSAWARARRSRGRRRRRVSHRVRGHHAPRFHQSRTRRALAVGKRPGDFEPCHHIGVYAESRDETVRAPFTNAQERHEDDDDTRDEASDGKSASEYEHESEEVEGSVDPPRWVAVVSQLDVVSLMAADADQLGAFPHVTTMETLGFASSSWAWSRSRPISPPPRVSRS